MRHLLPLTLCIAMLCYACPASHDKLKPGDSLAALPKTPYSQQLGGDTLDPKDASVVLYKFDTIFFRKKGRALTAEEARRYFYPLTGKCDQGAASEFDAVFHLDSLKKQGKDPEETGDIGSTVEARVTLLDSVQLPEISKAYVWSLYYESFPACPFSSGTYFFLTTYDKNGRQAGTQLLARDISAADPPAEFRGIEVARLFRDGSFKTVEIDSSGDEDDDSGKTKYEIQKIVWRGKILPDGKIEKDTLK